MMRPRVPSSMFLPGDGEGRVPAGVEIDHIGDPRRAHGGGDGLRVLGGGGQRLLV